MYKTIKRIKAGGGRLEDLDILLQHGQQHGHHARAPRSAAWPTARPGRSRTRWPSSGPSSRSTSGPTRAPAGGVTPLQEAIAHGDRRRAAGDHPRSPSSATRRPTGALRSTPLRPEGNDDGDDHHQRPGTHPPRGREAQRHPGRASWPGSTSPTTAGTPRSRSSPTAGCARSRSAARTPRPARSR